MLRTSTSQILHSDALRLSSMIGTTCHIAFFFSTGTLMLYYGVTGFFRCLHVPSIHSAHSLSLTIPTTLCGGEKTIFHMDCKLLGRYSFASYNYYQNGRDDVPWCGTGLFYQPILLCFTTPSFFKLVQVLYSTGYAILEYGTLYQLL